MRRSERQSTQIATGRRGGAGAKTRGAWVRWATHGLEKSSGAGARRGCGGWAAGRVEGSRGAGGEVGAGNHARGGHAAAATLDTAAGFAVDGGCGGVGTGDTTIAAAAARLVAVVGVLLLVAKFFFLGYG